MEICPMKMKLDFVICNICQRRADGDGDLVNTTLVDGGRRYL